MRISDWSSDVCSSDLAKDQGHLSKAAANHIASTVFPVGTSFSEIIGMIKDPAGPPKQRIRSGRFAPQENTSTHEHRELYTAPLDPARLSVPIPEPVILKVANTEPDEILSLSALLHNLQVLRATIPAGAHAVVDKLHNQLKQTEEIT